MRTKESIFVSGHWIFVFQQKEAAGVSSGEVSADEGCIGGEGV